MWSLSQVAKPIYEQYFSSLSADTGAPLSTAFTAGHTSSNTCAQHSTPNRTPRTRASNYTSRKNSLFAIQARRSFNQYEKKPQQDSHLHSCWSCECHIFLWLPTQTYTCAKTAVLLPGQWQGAGDGGSCQLQRSSGFWKKGWAVTWDQEALVFKESP